MFSIPINPKLTPEEFQKFYQFCKDHKSVIYDLYFTCRMPPFVQDAMGDVFDISDTAPIEAALYMRDSLGIKISATFNNIIVRPSQENLDLWVHNFRQLYDAGVRSATIPHTHWVATGQIQKAFPELEIKNTILRNVTTAAEVASLAKFGFHYINIERDLMRDRDSLEKIRRAADRYGVKIALLGNEGCLGGCAMMDEHFQFNNTRFGEVPQYFNDPISRVSCSRWDVTDPSVPLKTANIPPWREDWVDLQQYVDVFKMHGREAPTRLFETMDIVSRFARGEEILFDTFEDYLVETNLQNRPILAWREKIKNCKFDCWECNFCDTIYDKKSGAENHPLAQLVANQLVESVNQHLRIDLNGLTSQRVQQLLHNLAKHCKTYLEVGSGMGATAWAVAKSGIKMHCVDNWATNVQPESGEFELPDNTRAIFDEHLEAYKDILTVHQGEMLEIDRTVL
jgi:hypothetical protein